MATTKKKLNNNKTPSMPAEFININELKEFLLHTISSSIKSSHEELKTIICKVKDNQKFLSDKFDDLNNKIDYITNQHVIFKKDLSILKVEHEKKAQTINQLEADIDKINQKELINNIVIGGLPNNIDVNVALTNMMKILNTNCTIADVAETSYFRRNSSIIHNLDNHNIANINTAPLLLVKFKNIQSKTDFIEKKKERGTLFVRKIGINSPSERVLYVRDHVTHYKNTLFKECAKFKDECNIKFLWMKGHKILLRQHEQSKVYYISTHNDLNKIKTIFCNFDQSTQSLSQNLIVSTE